MPSEELQKHTLNLFSGDYEKIQSFYPDVGAAVIIRKVIRHYIEQVEAKGNVSVNGEVEINI